MTDVVLPENTTRPPNADLTPAPPAPPDPMTSDYRPAVRFNPDGTIRHAITQAAWFTLDSQAQGDLICFGDGLYNIETNQYGAWVDYVGGKYVVKPRPALGKTFDKSTVTAGAKTTMKAVPAGTKVTVTGPVNSSMVWTGGDMAIGWNTPGTYNVTVEAFPAMPATFVIKVTGLL